MQVLQKGWQRRR